MKKLHLAGMLAMVTVSGTALAGDTAFTPDAAATWSARTLLMAKVYDDAAAGTLTKQSFAVACDGLTGEQMKHEYGKEPRWALGVQLEVCSGFDGYAGKFGGSKKPCDMFKKGLKDLDDASSPGTPPEVVNAAAALRQTLTVILAASENGRKGCRL
ncbi:MAG: hypothetical protein V4459_03005 [Pseudomonadota bacterium]